MADLDRLAHRVETEEPSHELLVAIARELDWQRHQAGSADMWRAPDSNRWGYLPKWLTSIDAAAGLVSADWLVEVEQFVDGWHCILRPWGQPTLSSVRGFAPTEPRARAAAGLRAIHQLGSKPRPAPPAGAPSSTTSGDQFP